MKTYSNDNGRLSVFDENNRQIGSYTKGFLLNQKEVIEAQKEKEIANGAEDTSQRDAEINEVLYLLDKCDQLSVNE